MTKETRRIDVTRLTPAETAIRNAMIAVEEAGADPLLTDAVNLLQKARDKVADYVDGIPRQEIHSYPVVLSATSSRREIAEQIAADFNRYASPVDAIDQALRDRDERAAKAAKEFCDQFDKPSKQFKEQLMAAIRNGVADAK